MKAVLLQTMYLNGTRVPHAPEGPTIIEVEDAEFDDLVDRGVVRPVEKADLALAIVDAEIIEETPAPVKAEKPARARKAEAAQVAESNEEL